MINIQPGEMILIIVLAAVVVAVVMMLHNPSPLIDLLMTLAVGLTGALLAAMTGNDQRR